MTLYHDVAGVPTQTVIPVLNNGAHDVFYLKVRSFLDACRDGTASPVPTSQILYNQAIIDGIIRSAEQKKEIDIIIPEI